jgi:transcriptional regulator with XRE-family HTH domain
LRVKYVLGAELREERTERALTQEEAAAEVGVSTRTWQLWEAGDITPRAKQRRALAAWLEKTEAAA